MGMINIGLRGSFSVMYNVDPALKPRIISYNNYKQP